MLRGWKSESEILERSELESDILPLTPQPSFCNCNFHRQGKTYQVQQHNLFSLGNIMHEEMYSCVM